MFQINLPPFDTNIQMRQGKPRIFDVLRRRFVAVTPEEWVRQHFIHYLIDHKGYPQALLANEISLTLNGMWRRCDSVLYTADMQPRMIMEYKAPTVAITQEVFNQICAYTVFHRRKTKVPLLPVIVVSKRQRVSILLFWIVMTFGLRIR